MASVGITHTFQLRYACCSGVTWHSAG